METLVDYTFPGASKLSSGKVREIFEAGADHLLIVTTDRISAFDVVLPDVEAAERRVAECLAAGGRVVTDAHAPSYWVLADPEGNELCVCTASQDQAPAQN
mgnify:CR=1 FL=1